MFCHCALCGYRGGENNGKIFFPLPLPKHKVRLFLLPTYYSTLLQSNLTFSYTKGIFGLLLPSFAAKQKIKAQVTIVKNSQNR